VQGERHARRDGFGGVAAAEAERAPDGAHVVAQVQADEREPHALVERASVLGEPSRRVVPSKGNVDQPRLRRRTSLHQHPYPPAHEQMREDGQVCMYIYVCVCVFMYVCACVAYL
jgi:hypothetical protein